MAYGPIRMRAKAVPAPPNAHSFFWRSLSSPTPGSGPRVRRCRTRYALNLEVLGRGLAAVGDLFVLDALSFVECRKPSFLNCRNMNENVLAAVRGLDKPVTLGRVEPLHRTFSHSRRLRGIKQ